MPAYYFYERHNRERFQKDNSLASALDIKKLCALEWQKTWGKERKRYEDMHIEDKTRYSKDKAEYELQHRPLIANGT